VVSALESEIRHKLLSRFAFKIDLRLYNESFHVEECVFAVDQGVPGQACIDPKVGRCRLTVSKPELKAPLVSALETEI
jgi:hypothetical protein